MDQTLLLGRERPANLESGALHWSIGRAEALSDVAVRVGFTAGDWVITNLSSVNVLRLRHTGSAANDATADSTVPPVDRRSEPPRVNTQRLGPGQHVVTVTALADEFEFTLDVQDTMPSPADIAPTSSGRTETVYSNARAAFLRNACAATTPRQRELLRALGNDWVSGMANPEVADLEWVYEKCYPDGQAQPGGHYQQIFDLVRRMIISLSDARLLHADQFLVNDPDDRTSDVRRNEIYQRFCEWAADHGLLSEVDPCAPSDPADAD